MKKLIMILLLMGFGYSQSLPQPAVVGEDLEFPTLRISQFVKVDESVGVVDNRVTLGIKQLLEEEFQNTRYRLTEDDNADFTANVEVLYIGKPNEAFSIAGLFNRRNQSTEVRLLVNLVENREGIQKSYRGIGETTTQVSAAGLQIQEDVEFGKSELGGSLRKAIVNALENIE
ncbi:MAG: hypothetical protein CMD43_01855 [Gammaproteobacteria bacterium]|jgi:hypothetical protein|nr:hypothetical protein [Gammaproteobacteria bacterium]|tara:strand:+ start:1423 stop:1941 length:519 start_codon:yes stop_codon:yes gene_type:complete